MNGLLRASALINHKRYENIKIAKPLFIAFALVYIGIETWFYYSRKKDFKIEPQSSRLFYMQKRRIACLQLPAGNWRSIKAEKERDHASLLESLQSIFGKRMEFGK